MHKVERVARDHALVSTEFKSLTRAVYRCRCGVVGYATIGYTVTTPRDVKKAVLTNHKMHQTRAVMRALRETT